MPAESGPGGVLSPLANEEPRRKIEPSVRRGIRPPPNNDRPVLSGLPSDELTLLLEPLPAYRARQIKKWIARGASSFDEMTNLPFSLRDELAGRFLLRTGRIASRHSDPDGTIKLGLELFDGAKIESVLLTDE
ncbi:MAG: hypothetical protein LBJ90_04370, partial [Treponema sp.]|nr:hypothetical protein [Treponema sp.]